MKPKVTVIVPVYNNESGLEALLNALLDQSYPPQLFEIIIIDNGSGDKTLEIAKSFEANNTDRIKVLIEDRIQGSYAARNKGLAAAQGDIIAMTDSDCIPVKQWLEEGVRALDAQNAHLAGGQVTFFMSSKAQPAEMYDTIKNLQMKYYVEVKGSAPTANLFARRSVFDAIGEFDARMKSGGDSKWTQQATREGFCLIYAPEAEVYHPARKMDELLKKHYRVGGGVLSAWKFQGLSRWGIWKAFLRGFFPNKPKTIRKLIQENGKPEMEKKFWQIWLTGWLCNLVTNLGIVRSVFDN